MSRTISLPPWIVSLCCIAVLTAQVPDASAGVSYNSWTSAHGLSGDNALPTANPDGDAYQNILEYAFGTDPLVPETDYSSAPALNAGRNPVSFTYRVSDDSNGIAKFSVIVSTDLENWAVAPGIAVTEETGRGYVLQHHPTAGEDRFYRLEVSVDYTPALGITPVTTFTITVGTNVGSDWEGLPQIPTVVVRTQPPLVNGVPNYTKYPNVVGTARGSFTPELVAKYKAQGKRPPLRSWLGWFLWGNGTPPPGIKPGYPSTGAYDGSGWDYFKWQYSDGADPSTGKWNPVRLDQQPLYGAPIMLHYNWPAGQFGYLQQPLLDFPNETSYWKDKKIVRGPNLSFINPFFYQYGDKITVGDIPNEWRQAWLYMANRPSEALVVVPSNLKPDALLASGAWNDLGTQTPQGKAQNQPFPYPVWDTTLSPMDQTPFNIQVDRIGDFDADLIWEGTRPGAKNYDANHYQATAFSEPGKGNYLKMSYAQGSPFLWCETNNNKYVNFYNLFRTNLPGSLDNNTGTDAKTVPGGPWAIPGTGVEFVLLYGDQSNPNQWYQEVQPWYYWEPTKQPGGFNPPGMQHNHTYTAVFYRTDKVQSVALGPEEQNATKNNGIDSQGNPYFYLEFLSSGKNWFVVGSVPPMRYYHPDVTVDSDADRINAAVAWATEMGKYAFNFPTASKVSYAVTNMYQASSTFSLTLANPYVEAGVAGASAMTANPDQTVLALSPHQYQPLTLGPDLTQSGNPQVVWNPLKTYDTDFPAPAGPANANKSTPSSSSLWGYWSLRGNLKPIITGQFVTSYLFQNFLPVMPPPDFDLATGQFSQSGIQAVNITNVGTGYQNITNPPTVTISSPTGSGATFKALLDTTTGKIQQIDVVSKGSGYPDGIPPAGVTINIAAPPISGGVQATAYAQIGGGQVLAVFMLNQGSGYAPTIEVTQAGATEPAIVVPQFDANGNMLAGPAKVISSGAGFDFGSPFTVVVKGTGTGASAEVVSTGSIIRFTNGRGGFTNAGNYPSTGVLSEDSARIKVNITPPSGGPAQQGVVTKVDKVGGTFIPVVINGGTYTVKPQASYVDDAGATIQLDADIGPGYIVNLSPINGIGTLNTPKDVTFSGGSGSGAVAKVYPVISVSEVGLGLTGATVKTYTDDVDVTLTGGIAEPAGVTAPVFSYTFLPNGKLDPASLVATNTGSGLTRGNTFWIYGGRGFNAELAPMVDNSTKKIVAVKVLRGGSNYPSNIYIVADEPGGNGATFDATVENGSITSVAVTNGGSGYVLPALRVSAITGGLQDPKGPVAQAHYTVTGGHVDQVIVDNVGGRYIPGSETQGTATSLPAYLQYEIDRTPFAIPRSQGTGYIAEVLKPETKIQQVFYDTIISQYSTFTSKDQSPFGGAFQGGSAPDGYGLGNQLSASSRFIGDLFNFQQHFAADQKDQPDVTPSLFAYDTAAADGTVSYDQPIFKANSPIVSLSEGLKSAVQGLQRSLSLLFSGSGPVSNNPTNPETWKMDYFTLFDSAAGRIVINPTATIPTQGIMSSVPNPPAIPASEITGKTGLNEWKPGMLWSGFGVSDQWNDQHYFYGYYLGAAALAGIFDHAWEDTPVKPSSLWAGKGQMGTAIDQWVMTLAHDPDNAALKNSLYTVPQMTFQKFAFFDQWNGHGWASGAQPGPVVANIQDGTITTKVPWSEFLATGTSSQLFNGENENSIFEGMQAWSAVVLWGGATDRKSVADLGIYLMATEMAAADLYFLDKNYNFGVANNNHSWVPVTTVDAGSVNNNGGNQHPAKTDYVTSNPEPFYISPEFFGGAASAGVSLLTKTSLTLNNFFYAYPTGSKFIEAFPPGPWTMGISRNSDYMRKWAGAMMRQEWNDARNSALYQPGNWLSMALTSAMSGVPYNPGDVPYPMTGTTPNSPELPPYVDRLWSSWVGLNAPAGANISPQPAFRPISVLSQLLSHERWGYPDWTYIAKVTDGTGVAQDNQILFSAVFTKVEGSTLKTTYLLFNPGWETRYAKFFRLQSDGSIPTAGATGVIQAKPKRLVIWQTSAPVP